MQGHSTVLLPMRRLIALAPEIWHATHDFKVGGLPVLTRMTVVRLGGGGLWLHSPIPLDKDLRSEIESLGRVEAVVAPNKVHHLFLAECAAAFPSATVYGAPGLAEKRPDIPQLRVLPRTTQPGWKDQLDQVFFGGIPFANETLWFHHPSATLIVTDLVQLWAGDLAWPARLYASLTGVRKELAIPRTVRALVRDRDAARKSAERILEWPIQRVILAHNSIVEADAYERMSRALAPFLR